MSGMIRYITVNDTYDSVPINIDIEGRNVIITGGNGCGKTRLVERVFKNLFSRFASRDLSSIEDITRELESYKNGMNSVLVGSSQWSFYQSQIPRAKEKLFELESFHIGFSDSGFEDFLASYQKNESILLYFPATRMAKIDSVISVRPLNLIKETSNQVVQHYDVRNPENSNTNKTRFFEEYLVSLKQTASMLFTEYKDKKGKLAVDNWFKKLESDLGSLFEDSTLKLNFDVENGQFKIIQSNKEPYGFQHLSSGFSSILSIYVELMMNVEVKNVLPNELQGIVVIDEIDAHLHISLQKRIFSFLTDSFPNIQFIVTTHSPFVVMSVSDAIIYDLSTKSQVEDLSAYSYASVATGLFKTAPVSEIISEKIKNLASLVNSSELNLNLIRNIIKEISPHENELDEVSLLFLRKAQLVVASSNKDSKE